MVYEVLDAPLMRASLFPSTLELPTWPDLTDTLPREVAVGWLTRIWADERIANAITAASPTLATQVDRICAGRCDQPRQMRRAVVSVARYLLRMTGRSTPFGLFAGIAPARLGPHPGVRWGHLHQAVLRADGAWLAEVITRLEQCLPLSRRLTVVLNELAEVRDDRLVVPHQRLARCDSSGQAPSTVEVSVRHTAAVAAIVTSARTPIVVVDLIAKLSTEFPNASTAAVEAAIVRLVRTGTLLTCLRPPTTATDGLGHLLAQLTAVDAESVPEVAATAKKLRAIHDQMGQDRASSGQGERSALPEQMNELSANHDRPVVTDLRLDTQITLPNTLIRHAQDAASALARLTPYPRGLPAWKGYHDAFLERYGVGALVPLAEVVDPSIGLGLPATYRGSHRRVTAAPLSSRDRALLRLVQLTTASGGQEIVLDDRMIADLASADEPPGQVPPHVELFCQIHADSLAALQRDQYTLMVSGAARAAGATTGRFLHLLRPDDRERFAHAYSAVATVREGALAAQLSFPPLQAASDHLASAPPTLPYLLHAGELITDDAAIRLTDLAIGGDADGLFFVSLRRERLIEPTALNAVEFRYFSHPLARFLCELPRATAGVYMPFSWGAAEGLPFLPRLRSGRTVLTPACWTVHATDLPPAREPWRRWHQAFSEWQQRFRLPNRVYLVQGDNLLALDLTVKLHQALLRAHLDQHSHVRLDEAPNPNAYGWIDGHPHEIAIPLRSTEPPKKGPSKSGIRVLDRDEAHLPGAAPWLYAKLYAPPACHTDILNQAPSLTGQNDAGPDLATDWWYLPYHDPEPHLRLRIRLPNAAAYAAAATRIGAWAIQLRRRRLLGRMQLDTYFPETGRYGHGEAMAAAESVFAADSTAAIAEITAATTGTIPLDALITASLVDLTLAFTGDAYAGMRWLLTQLPNQTAPAGRAVRAAATALADPSEDWAALRAADHDGSLIEAFQQRRIALAAYRRKLAPQRDPLSVLPSLLHLHSIRVHGIDPDRERLSRRLARATALRWSAVHNRPTSTAGPP